LRAKSVCTTIADPYRAALSLGQSLSEISPEVVFLFLTTHYDDWTEFIDGLFDGLNDPSVRVIGTTGDGVYESARVSDTGACALGLSSDGQVAWHVESGGKVDIDPEGAVRCALAKLSSKLEGRQPAFYFMVSDSHADASRIETVIRDEVPVPVIGGLAGDDNSNVVRGFSIADRRLLRDSVVILAADGPEPFQIHLGNSVTLVGQPGVVDDANGKTLNCIDGADAASFIEQATGKPILRSDQGIALSILSGAEGEEKRLRAVAQNVASKNGSLSLHGGIREGEQVQVCVTRAEDLEAGARAVAMQAAASGFQPAAALVVSCAGRKWLLGGQIQCEAEAVSGVFGRKVPLAGFSSFGEIAPLPRNGGGYTRNLFHNMTYVLLFIGT